MIIEAPWTDEQVENLRQHALGGCAVTDAEKLAAIERMCQRNANAGVNPGAHRLAVDVLAIIRPDGWAAALVAQSEPERLPSTPSLCDLWARPLHDEDGSRRQVPSDRTCA